MSAPRTDPPPPDDDAPGLGHILGYRLAQAAIRTARVFALQVGEPYELRPVEFTILALLHEQPEYSSARLARTLGVTAANVTILLDRLEERALVQRERSEVDRRLQRLRLTAEGERIATECTQRLLQAEREAFARLSPGERLILVEILRKLAQEA